MGIKFGWAEVDITPREKIVLVGEFFERVTSEVETPITVTAFAIESEGEQAVFCSCDLEGINESLVRHSRRKLHAPGLDPQKVMIHAVHTHNSYTIVTEYQAEAILRHRVLARKFPLRRVTESDRAEAEVKIKAFWCGKTSVNYIDSAELHVHMGILQRYDMQKERTTVNTEIQVIRLGDIAFATSPFELFLAFGNQIRARSDVHAGDHRYAGHLWPQRTVESVGHLPLVFLCLGDSVDGHGAFVVFLLPAPE